MLPKSWVEAIFNKLALSYGNQFTEKWRSVDADALKAEWAEKLAGFSDRKDVLKAALDASTEKPFPPNLAEFLETCRIQAKRLQPELPALPAPVMTDEEAAANKARLENAMRKTSKSDGLLWAKVLRTQYLSGVKLVGVQISMASEVLGEVWENGRITERKAAA